MKKDGEIYKSNPDLKFFKTFYLDSRSLNPKQKLPPIIKPNKSIYNNQKKPKENDILTPRLLKFNLKKIETKNQNIKLNFKMRIKEKLKKIIKSPQNSGNTSRNLKMVSFNQGNKSLENEKNISKHFINFISDYEKDFFYETLYFNMKYNENEIFRPKSVYDKFVKEKFYYLKNNKSFNKTTKFKKNFKFGKYQKEVNLILNSMEISFKDISINSEVTNKTVIINFPFDLLPIFYYKGIEAFVNFLSYVIKVENNFEHIYFQQDKIYDALNNLKNYKDEDETFLRSCSRNLNGKDQIQLKPQILKKIENFLKYNYFVFFWVTNVKTYAVNIKLPFIHLNILDNKIEINHFIDYQLLFYLFQKNFINWEYYIIKYFSTYSKFRNIFQQIGPKSKIYNQTILFKEPKTKINSFIEENLINVYTDPFNNNQILSFKSFYLTASIKDINYHQEENYLIHFNFMQFVKLYQIAQYSNKIPFLIKFIEVNKEFNSISFNFEEYDKFNTENWLENIKKFSNKSLKNKNEQEEELSKEFKIFEKIIKVEYKKPSWTIIKLENDNIIQKIWEIGNDLEKDLVDSIVDSGSDSWTKLLNECLKKLNEPIPDLPIINKKTLKRKHSKTNLYLSSDHLNRSYRKRFSTILNK